MVDNPGMVQNDVFFGVSWLAGKWGQEDPSQRHFPAPIFLPASRCPIDSAFSASAERCYPDLYHARRHAFKTAQPVIWEYVTHHPFLRRFLAHVEAQSRMFPCASAPLREIWLRPQAAPGYESIITRRLPRSRPALE